MNGQHITCPKLDFTHFVGNAIAITETFVGRSHSNKTRRVAQKNGKKLVKQTMWKDKPTCVYAVERSIWLIRYASKWGLVSAGINF